VKFRLDINHINNRFPVPPQKQTKKEKKEKEKEKERFPIMLATDRILF
jgi:hypothetical protein